MTALAKALLLTLFLQALCLAQANDILIADFEGNDYGDWQVTGQAFGNAPARGTLPSQMDVTGFQGDALVNTFHQGDQTTGALTSPPFALQRKYINFLIGGGKFPGKTCINLLLDGKVVRTATGPNDKPGGSETLTWISWDVSEFIGRQARLQIVDDRTEFWGHINVDHILQSDQPAGPPPPPPPVARRLEILAQKAFLNLPVKNGAPMQRLNLSIEGQQICYFDIELAPAEPDFWTFIELSPWTGKTVCLEGTLASNAAAGFKRIKQADTFPGQQNLYREKLRPQFHFTSRRGWNNDSNGLMYYDGQYHLFYQHNPFGWKWGNMHWGHAISPDLLHWAERPDAIHPDHLGTIFSGSGVVDLNNTTGFQTGTEKPLVCIYTSAGSPFTQSIAYSIDRGKTWTKYDHNPVLAHIVDANRDPKVIYHQPSQRWVMALFLTGNAYALFTSADLKQWTRTCDVDMPGCGECPDFFPMPLHDDPAQIYWVFWAANGGYRLGTFDGKTFTPQTEVLHAYAAGTGYAGQTFDNIPAADGRRIHIAWLRGDLPNMPFNQQMTFPVTFTLRQTPAGPRICCAPVDEIRQLCKKTHTAQDLPLKDTTVNLTETVSIKGDLFDIDAQFTLGDAEQVGFNLRGIPLVYDVQAKTLTCGGAGAALDAPDGRIHLRILLDRASVEVFADQGGIYIPLGVIPDEGNHGLEVFARGGQAHITLLTVHELQSIWP